MEDEQIAVDVYKCRTPSFISRLGGSSVNKVESLSTDLIGDVKATSSMGRGANRLSEEGTEPAESAKGNAVGATTGPAAVDILRRNCMTSESFSVKINNNNIDHQDRPEAAGDIVSNQADYEEDDKSSNGETELEEEKKKVQPSEHSAGLMSSALDEVGLTHQEGYCESSRTVNEPFHLKPHVFCTVYCIANDNYRKTPSVDTSRDSTDNQYDGVASPSTSELESDADMSVRFGSGPESYPVPNSMDPRSIELYTVSNLTAPHSLSTVYNGAHGVSVLTSCRVCLDDKHIKPLHCCKKAVCEECLKRYISSQVRLGRSDIICPITECSGFLEESVVVSYLANDEVAKYRYFLELGQLDTSTKPCPQCSQFTSLKTRTPSRAEQKYKIECVKCKFVWCFKCHAPWHEGLKCRDYRRGDKQLHHWASVIEHGQRNAQKCPRCKIHIQRTEGCDHMTCTQCNTNFCYRCGERYRHLRFFGDHTSNLSVFGCKYRYLPDRPHLRRLVRGSVCDKSDHAREIRDETG
ncbi:E3 ubiquitin-protein ligase RNF217-like [Aplochiton taeniatus]